MRVRYLTRRYSTAVALPAKYDSDLESLQRNRVDCGYGYMSFVVAFVIAAFALLYLGVVAEERHMREALKVRKR
jgi:hypothetical protein